MITWIELSILTLFPLALLASVGGVSAWKIRKTGEYRLLLLVVVLVFMLSHQLLEVRTIVVTAGARGPTGLSDWIETGANTLAAVAVYYGTVVFEQERQLRTDLERSERRYRTLTEQSPLPILVLEGDVVDYANEAMTDLAGADNMAKLTDLPVEELFPERDRDEAMEHLDEVLDGDADRTFAEQCLRRVDGTERTVVFSGGRTDYDRETTVHLVFRDVTQEREIQRELERTRDHLEATLESSNDAIFLIDPDDESIIEANDTAASLLKYDRDELVGLSPFDIHPHEIASFEAFVERVFENGELRTEELRCLRKDGVEIPAEVSASVTTVDGRDCILAAVRDITERRRREKQVEVLGRVLRHNLRNDMTVVLGHAGFVEANSDDEEIVNVASTIRNIASDLVDLSQQVRDLEATIREEDLRRGSVDVRAVVEGIVAEFREGYPNAELTVDLPATATVHEADTEPLAWAVSNLVENAIEHHDGENPQVRVSVEGSDSRRGDWVVMRVADDGPGIPETERGVAVNPTEQTELEHSTGIGLWVVGHVVDAFGGYVSFEDSEEGGTVVNLHLRGTIEATTQAEA